MSFCLALEASSLLSHKRSGIQRYIFELSSALTATLPEGWTVRLSYPWTRYRKRHLRPELSTAHVWELPLVGLRGIELVHALDTRLPRSRYRHLVCTVHDLFSIVLPGHGSRSFRRRKRASYARIARLAERIIVPSQATRGDLLEHTGVQPERIRVVPHGVSSCFVDAYARDKGVRGGYVLAFGGGGRKNLVNVVRAFALARLPEELTLKVVGAVSGQSRAEASRLGVADRLQPLGRMSDAAMAGLYAGAAMLCFPSLCEGFGLPVLESMAAGTPVVTSRTGATAEIGKHHAQLVDPHLPEAIARGMEAAAQAGPEQLRSAHDYARGFSWERCAAQTLSVYRECLGS